MTQVNVWIWMKHKLENVTFSYSDRYQCLIQYLMYLSIMIHVLK